MVMLLSLDRLNPPTSIPSCRKQSQTNLSISLPLRLSISMTVEHGSFM